MKVGLNLDMLINPIILLLILAQFNNGASRSDQSLGTNLSAKTEIYMQRKNTVSFLS